LNAALHIMPAGVAGIHISTVARKTWMPGAVRA
jgi:hypothetical protein